MTYVITHGPIGDELEEGCETARDALDIITRLKNENAVCIMAAVYLTEREAGVRLRALMMAEDELEKMSGGHSPESPAANSS